MSERGDHSAAIKAADLTKLAGVVNSLNMLLAWDLATTKPHAEKAPLMVELRLHTGGTGFQPTLYFNSLEIEELVGMQTAKCLNKLQEAGIDVSDTLAAFKTTAERLLGITKQIPS